MGILATPFSSVLADPISRPSFLELDLLPSAAEGLFWHYLQYSVQWAANVVAAVSHRDYGLGHLVVSSSIDHILELEFWTLVVAILGLRPDGRAHVDESDVMAGILCLELH